MKLILRSDVEGLGRSGDVVDVSDGYARNYLVPKGLAMKATKGAAVQAEAMQRSRALKLAASKADALTQAAKLGPSIITLSAKSGDGRKLFGSITSLDVAAAIVAQTGIEIDRKAVKVEPAIKTVGSHSAVVHLHPEVDVSVTVEVSAIA